MTTRRRAASYEHLRPPVPTPAKAHEPYSKNHSGHAAPVPTGRRSGPRKQPTPEVFTERQSQALTEWLPLDSTRVRQARYDYGNEQVEVVFRDGTPWVYENVPPELYDQFTHATSAGKFINDVLNNYPYRRGDF